MAGEAHTCGAGSARGAACGKPASLGFRPPGLWSRLPEKMRRYAWACPEHAAEAEAAMARLCRANGYEPASPIGRKPEQASLFG